MYYTEKFNIADILTEIQDRLHVGPGETRSNEELMVLYDPDDLMVILPDFPIVYDPLGMSKSSLLTPSLSLP